MRQPEKTQAERKKIAQLCKYVKVAHGTPKRAQREQRTNAPVTSLPLPTPSPLPARGPRSTAPATHALRRSLSDPSPASELAQQSVYDRLPSMPHPPAQQNQDQDQDQDQQQAPPAHGARTRSPAVRAAMPGE